MQLLNQSALLNMLGWALFNSLWQMSLMWLLYVVITSGGKKFSANARHSLALFFLGTGSAWFVFSLIANCFNNNFSQQAIVTTNIFSAAQGSFFISTKQLINNLLPYFSLAYLMVLVFLLVRYLKYYVYSQHLKQTGLCKAPVELRIFIEDIAARVGINKNVKLWLSSAIKSPMTIGFLKPVILIPLATITHLSMQQMEAVLLHELAHIKRNDYLLNLIVAVTEIIFFFNPFSLLLVHAIKKERENSCDDLVMQFRYDPCAYASALLSLEKARHKSHELAMAAVGKNNKLLLQRVMRITEQKNTETNNGPRFILFILIAITAAFTALVQPQNIVAKIINNSEYKIQSPKPSEVQQVNYVIEGSINKKKEKIFPKKKKSVINNINEDKIVDGNDIELVKNDEQEDVDNSTNINQAIATEEPRTYSITQPAAAAAPADISLDNYPYVPSASFSYKETEDTTVPKRMLLNIDAERDAQLSMEKSLKAINKIDWKKIEKEITVSGKNVDIEKLQNEIRKSLRNVDWDKINQDVNSTIDEADERRIKQDLQVQLETLKVLKYKDLQKARQLQQQINKQQLMLHQISLKKQRDLMRQIEEMRKKSKIVYI